MAAFVSYPMAHKKLPSLRLILHDRPTRIDGRQTPDAQRAFFYEFARRFGLKVERHAAPVIKYPVN
jgi:hypothetical protein